MKIYFLSSQPCALTVSGAYFGVTDRFEKFAEASLKDGLFLSFTPENAQPISFFLTEDVLSHPPRGTEIYRLPGALAIYARDFPPLPAPLTLHAQARLENALVTVFSQGEVQCSVQTEENVFNATLPPSFRQCKIEKHGEFYLFRSPESLAVFHETGKRVFLERVREYSIENNLLNATLPLSDSRRREAECVFLLTPQGAERQSIVLRQPNSPQAREDLLFFAFLESVLYSADPTPFLCDELCARAEALTAFLGNFTSVVLTDDPLVCGLAYRIKEGLFEVRYYHAEVHDGKIIDIKG